MSTGSARVGEQFSAVRKPGNDKGHRRARLCHDYRAFLAYRDSPEVDARGIGIREVLPVGGQGGARNRIRT